MPVTRLTKDHKKFITNKASHHLKEEFEVVKKRLESTILEGFLSSVPEKVMELYKNDDLQLYIERTRNFNLKFVKSIYDGRSTEKPHAHIDELSLSGYVPCKEWELTDSDMSPKIHEHCKKLFKQYKEAWIKYREAYNAIYSELMSVATVKALLEQWPEAKDFLPDGLQETRHVVTTKIDADRLNKVLQL